MFKEITNINQLINEVTNYACKYADSEKKEAFRKYFEDAICYEVITSTKIEVCANEEKRTGNIMSSLIASGMNREGRLDRDLALDRMVKYLHLEDYQTAKAKVIEQEKEEFGKPFKEVVADAYADSINNEEVIDPARLLLIGCSMKDRESGYYETRYDRMQDYYAKDAKKIWLSEKQKYFKNGLTDRPYYIILKEIFENSDQHHYPLITRQALCKAVDLTYRMDNDMPIQITSELQEMYKLNDASSLIDMDVIQTFNSEIMEASLEYANKHGEKPEEKTKVLKNNQ